MRPLRQESKWPLKWNTISDKQTPPPVIWFDDQFTEKNLKLSKQRMFNFYLFNQENMIKDCFLHTNKRAKISINKGGEGLI